jgi:hypothetical protein
MTSSSFRESGRGPRWARLAVAAVLSVTLAGVVLSLSGLVRAADKKTPPAAAASTDPVHPAPAPVAARFPAGSEEEEGSGGALPVKPCELVTQADAAAITAAKIVHVFEAPLGPTCVYEQVGSKDPLTLTLQERKFSAIQRDSTPISKTALGHGTAYCVRFGAVTTYVPLQDGRVLTVTASCAVGRAMAAKALGRL